MRSLRRTTKSDVLLNLFEEVGTTVKLEDVYSITGIKNYNSLKAFLSYIRNSNHVDDGSRIDVRIKDGLCIRVN